MQHKNAGFTLVEIILAMAVSGLLVVIALVGQHELQARARFDTAIDKTIQNFNYARNYASSHVNSNGNGTDTTTVVAGSVVELKNGHYDDGFPLFEITTLYAQPDGSGYTDMNTLAEVPLAGMVACPAADHPNDNDECHEDFLSVGDPIRVVNDTFSVWAQVEFLNTSHGVQVCYHPDSTGLSLGQACQAAYTPVTFTFNDAEGFSAKIQIGTDGYAHRT